MRLSLIAALLLTLSGPVAAASAVDTYLVELQKVEQSHSPTSLAPLFQAAEAAQTELMAISDEHAQMETLSDAEFAALQQKLRGLELHRGMDVYAQPVPAFFLALARAHGLPEDVAFFQRHSAVWGPDFVPTYLMVRSQPTPCVRFGEHRIAPLYQQWRTYTHLHPKAYPDAVAQNLHDLEEAVALGTCACGNTASVLAEQRDFLKQFPHTPVAGQIRARMQQLRTDPEKLPVNCR